MWIKFAFEGILGDISLEADVVDELNLTRRMIFDQRGHHHIVITKEITTRASSVVRGRLRAFSRPSTRGAEGAEARKQKAGES